MKAPDKIYIQQDMINNLILEKQEFDDDVAYIRKDVLLEWIRKEYETISWYCKKMGHVTGCVGDNSSSGKAEAYKKVIGKIESL